MPVGLPLGASDPIERFRDALRHRAIIPPPQILGDGRLHRCDAEGRNGKGDAAYLLHLDGIPAGGFENHRDGSGWETWRADIGRTLTPAEDAAHRANVEAMQREREAEKARQRAEAAKQALAIWKAATPARADHSYLLRKLVSPVVTLREIDADAARAILGYSPKSKGELLSGRLLVVPVKVGDKLSTAELIDDAGRKSALYGGEKKGGFWAAQQIPEGDNLGAVLMIGEGAATGLSARESTGHLAIAALSAANLAPVAQYWHARCPQATLIILADLVKATGEPDSHAIEAARSVGALLAIPNFGNDRPEGATDFNDLHRLRGAATVRAAIEQASAPGGDVDGWPEPLPLVAKVEPEPYPLDALPNTVRAAVIEVQEFTKAPISMVASSALGALSLAIQAYTDVKRAEKLTAPTSLFLLTIADSGERKSTCDGFFTAAIRDYEAEQAEAAKPKLKDHRAAVQSWESKRAGIKDQIRLLAKKGSATNVKEAELRDLGDAPEPPRVPRLNYGDATPEALKWNLAKLWPSGGVVSAEGGNILGAHGMNKESIMRNLATLNELWDGKPLSTERRTSESFTVRGGRLTMGIQVQEATLRSFFDRSDGLARGTGFLARFLVAWPESMQGFRPFSDPPASWPALVAFNRRIAAMLKKPAPIDDEGALSPPVLPLAPEAKAAWITFHDAIEGELRTGGELYDVRDVASKSADNAARLAALFQVFEHDTGGAVGLEAFAGACRVAAWHLNESRRFFGELALPVELANAARLDTWLIQYCRREQTNVVARKKVQQFGPGGLREKAALTEALRELAEAGRVRVVHKGRRKEILVNPVLIEGGAA